MKRKDALQWPEIPLRGHVSLSSHMAVKTILINAGIAVAY